jgi:hypothetical protein
MKKINLPLISNCIYKIYEETAESLVVGIQGKNLTKEINTMKRIFSLSETEIILLVPIIVKHFNDEPATFHDLRNHFCVPALEMLQFQEILDGMVDKKIIENQLDARFTIHSLIKSRYTLNIEVSKAITGQTIRKQVSDNKYELPIDFLEAVFKLCDSGIYSSILNNQLIIRYDAIISGAKSLDFISSIKALQLSKMEEIIYMCLIWRSLESSEGFELDDAVQLIMGTKEKIIFKQSVFNNENPLVSKELVELRKVGLNESLRFFLTSDSIESLALYGIKIVHEDVKKKVHILPQKIAEKQLFYNDSEQGQISSLEAILREENYQALKNRLLDKNLPVGLNILLFGAPGTGKTETVYQLARQTGREIIKVEISQTKSKWFGESEKLIKQIFENYTSFAKRLGHMPILLFNEADAILSNRSTNTEDNVRQTENAIQNILLEELEKFQGIFFATTNLANNLDKAFDRRFLYKVEFAKPGILQRKAILEKKIPFLTAETCLNIASEYDLSGGQIENIARKCEIYFIMNGKTPNDLDVINFCKEDLAISNIVKNSIGFKNR